MKEGGQCPHYYPGTESSLISHRDGPQLSTCVLLSTGEYGDGTDTTATVVNSENETSHVLVLHVFVSTLYLPPSPRLPRRRDEGLGLRLWTQRKNL